MLLRLLIIISGLLFANSLIAQQWHLSPVYHGRHIYDIAILERAHIVSAGGNESNAAFQEIFNSVSGGMTWNFSNNRGGGYVRSVDFTDSQNGIAVGWRGTILKTDNGAYYWDSVPPPTGLEQRNFTKVLYTSPQTLIAFGGKDVGNDTMQTIIKSINGGDTWTTVRDVQGRWLKSANFINATTAFAVGGKGTILKTTDGGNNWAAVNSPLTDVELNAVCFVNATTGFIAGGTFAEFDTLNSTRILLKTTDGGNNWNIIFNEPGGWLNAITFSDVNNGYMVGDGGTLYKTTNGGNNWFRETVTGSSGFSHFTSVKFLNNDFGVVGGLFGEVYLYSNEPLPQVQTQPASIVQFTDTSANVILSADINTNGNPVIYNIAYSLTADFSSFNYFINSLLYPATFNSTVLTPVEGLAYHLLRDTTYYFYAFATLPNGVVYGDTLSVYTGSLPYREFMTYQPQTFTGSAAFSASIANPLVAMNTYFEYGTTPNFGNQTQGNPFTVNQPIPYYITDTVYSLIPDTIYYCRLKATSAADTFYSNTVQFFSGVLYSNLDATDATNITSSSAVLNATVNGLGLPLSYIAFQYGTNPNQLNDYVMVENNYINDNFLHTFSTPITGLIPNTFYYFRLVGDTDVGRQHSNIHSFYTGILNFTFQTNVATTVGQSYATFNGFADNLPFAADISFEYGTAPNFLNTSVAATPSSVSDALPHSFTAFVTGLQPSTTYYYRLVGETQNGFFYGNIQSFSTVFSSDYFSTLAATQVTASSAQLNGIISGFAFPATLSFEYGLTENFGNEVPSNPASISDNQPYYLAAPVAGLLADTVYYFRLKATAGNQIFYTQTRKIYTGEPEILNWNFEQWEDANYLLPDGWNILNDTSYQRVQGHSGNYALQLTQANMAIMGFPGDGGTPENGPRFLGGCSFDERPDSVVFYLKYALNPLDSAMFLFQLRNSNEIIASKFYFITGSSGGNFQRFSFPITYLSSAMPDSIALGFATLNLFSQAMNDHSQNSITIDDISFYPSTTAICNLDLENWFSFPFDNLKDWHYSKALFVNPDDVAGSVRVIKTTGVETPGFAAQLRTTVYANMLVSTEMSNSRSKNLFTGNTTGTLVSRRYQFLNGYYNYQPASEDSLFIDVNMYKDGVNIGYGTYKKGGNTNGFAPFDILINYTDEQVIPDTVIINIRNSNFGHATGFSVLTIDRFSFDGFWQSDGGLVTSIENATTTEAELFFQIYPNPSKNTFAAELSNAEFKTVSATIFDINGRILQQTDFPVGQPRVNIDISGFNAGIYFVQVRTDQAVYTKKMVVVK